MQIEFDRCHGSWAGFGWADYIEDLGWNHLGLQPSEMLEVVVDHDVWRLNLELLPPQPSRT